MESPSREEQRTEGVGAQFSKRVWAADKPKYLIVTASLSACLGLLLVMLWEARILSCSPSHLSDEWYTTYCPSMTAFNDYPATLFNIHGAIEGARNTDVLFLGNSSTQVSFSNLETLAFFKAIDASFYLLGYGYGERWEFPSRVIKANKLKPVVLVINISGGFFAGGLSPRAKHVLQHPVEEYLVSQVYASYQGIQAAYCKGPGRYFFCYGSKGTVFRSRLNGTWKSGPGRPYDAQPEERYGCAIEEPGPTYCGLPLNHAGLRSSEPSGLEVAVATQFVDGFTLARGCIVLTAAPILFTEVDKGRALTDRLGTEFIDVDKTGLYMMDRNHLIIQSAETYAKRFLAQLAPVIERCRHSRATGSGGAQR